jgi:4-amino-4-deoxy-L-arabinose transferase-like glycosyltransferase
VTALVDAPAIGAPVVRGQRWHRRGLALLLAATAVLYLWDLSSSGFGNTFYAAAAQAGSQSWSAWFFGSLDAHNFITVDKPPASLWVTGLSMRLFGVNSWSALVPQALMGVGAVAVLYATVRRTFAYPPANPDAGAVAGLLAGATLAFSPAAALIFRFNNPDALLVLLLTGAAYCLTRAVSAASWRWLQLAGAVMGLAFLTKMLQAFLVAPALAVAYLLFAPTAWHKRILHLSGAVAVLIAAAGWWVVIVALVPESERPYIGGSTDNTVLDLAFGYNGIARILGHHHGSSPSDWAGPQSFGARSGLHRLVTGEMGNEIAWLMLTAVIAAGFGTYLAARRQLSRMQLCALTIWGGWFAVTGLVFSYMGGMIHPYYTVALAPSIAGLVGTVAVWSWQRRTCWDGRSALAAMTLASGVTAVLLLHRNHFGPPWVGGVIASAAVLGAVGLLVPRPTIATAALAALASSAGTVTFSIATAFTPHHGSIPSAAKATVTGAWIGDEATNEQIARLLAATRTQWSAATNGSQSAAELEMASGTSVMAVGGWSGDPVPTLQQFIDDVHAGKVTYYVEAGRAAPHEVMRSPAHTASHTREIADWVAQHYSGTVIGRSTVYRLS